MDIIEILQLRFSALQRAEIAEIHTETATLAYSSCFSALQRAEIAEIRHSGETQRCDARVSVLFNEPKLLKSGSTIVRCSSASAVSVLFNEPKLLK